VDKYVEKRMLDKSIEDIFQNVLNILQSDDGKSDEEKKKAALDFLQSQMSSNKLVEKQNCVQEAYDGCPKNTFWRNDSVVHVSPQIELRKVCDSDCEKYLAVRAAYFASEHLMNNEMVRRSLWENHTKSTALMFSIYQNNDYAGYCGIHDLTSPSWELTIELLPEKTNQGIGTTAMTAMLNEIKRRWGISEFCVRIEPTNLASQSLFENLGAVPDGIAALEDDPRLIEACEAENLHLIDDKLKAVAKKFSVEPRKLLSHVLKYTLKK